MLVAYVSGHGWGHSTRTAEVLRALRVLEPSLPLGIVTSAPEALYRESIPGPFTFRNQVCDVGLAQRDALVIDEPGTLRRLRDFEARRVPLAAIEARWLRQSGARLVLADIPPLAFEVAAEAGVPAVGLANFSWDWIYACFARRQPAFEAAAIRAADAYRKAHLLLELPFAGDLSAFPRRQQIPLVARRPEVPGAEARRRLGLDSRPAVLVSFGGLGLPGFNARVLGTLGEYNFLLGEECPPAAVPNVVVCDRPRLSELGLRYHDLVGAVDVVLSKPGYGIVSDTIAAGKRLLYTERGDFPEYPILVEEMQQYLPTAHVSNEDVTRGRLGPALRALLAQGPRPSPGWRRAACWNSCAKGGGSREEGASRPLSPADVASGSATTVRGWPSPPAS
jgi:L-arabinokinase